MPKLTAFTLAVLLFVQLHAQRIEKEASDLGYLIVPSISNQNRSFAEGTARFPGAGPDYRSGRVMLSPTEAVVLTYVDKEEEYIVRKIDNKLQEKWQAQLAAVPLFMGQLNGNILIITGSPIKNFGWKNNFDALLMDPNTGKILSQKNIFTGTEDYFCEPKLLIASNGESFYFGMRETPVKKVSKFSLTGSAMEAC